MTGGTPHNPNLHISSATVARYERPSTVLAPSNT